MRVSRLLSLGLPVLLLAGCLGVSTPSSAPVDVATPGTWTSLAPMPTPRREVAVAALRGHVWVIGGFGAAAAPTAPVAGSDPAANEWTAQPAWPVAVHNAVPVTVGDRLFGPGAYAGRPLR